VSAAARAAHGLLGPGLGGELGGHLLRDGVGLRAPLVGFGGALLGGGRAGFGGDGTLLGGRPDGLDLGSAAVGSVMVSTVSWSRAAMAETRSASACSRRSSFAPVTRAIVTGASGPAAAAAAGRRRSS